MRCEVENKKEGWRERLNLAVLINNKNRTNMAWGAAISLAGQLGSSLFSGISQAKAAKKQKKNIEKSKAENEAWYNRRYNEDATQRADAQRLLRLTQESIRNRNREAAATQAVVGGTEESVAATKEANAKALAETASAIAAQGEARKDAIEQQYLNRNQTLNDQLNGIEANKIQQTAEAGAQAISAFGNMGSALSKMPAKYNETQATAAAQNGGAKL